MDENGTWAILGEQYHFKMLKNTKPTNPKTKLYFPTLMLDHI